MKIKDTGFLTSLMQAKQLISTTKIKIDLIPQNNNRPQRWLINIVDTASKWFFGALGNDDRESINKALTK